MDPGPSSTMVRQWNPAPVAGPSNDNYPQTATNLSTGKIRSANSSLPPPPSYYGKHLTDFSFLKSDPFFIANWSVIAKRVTSEQNDSCLVVELSGTLLKNDRRTISKEKHYAGTLEFMLAKNVVKTTYGVYHLVGPIFNGSPNNLYRACLETKGIPKTWKYILTQFSSKLPSYDQSTMSTARPLVNIREITLPELVRSLRILRRLMDVTNRKVKEFNTSRKPVSFARFQFNQKLVYSCGVINNQIKTCLASQANSE